jgi:hypothetical protein
MRSSPPTGETPGPHTSISKQIPELRAILLLDRNFIQTPSPRYCRDLPGHEHTGGTEEGSIDGANKTIDNKVNIALVLTGS